MHNNERNIKVYVVHGFMASRSDHWFQWLKQQLAEKGIAADLIALPNSSSPVPDAWQNTLSKEITRLDRDTYFVAHSLGCVALLTNLQNRLHGNPIGGVVLVSGFTAPLADLPQLDDFVAQEIAYKKIIDATTHRVVFGSPEDPIVPYQLTESTAKQLSADLYPVRNAGHFLAENGYKQFPQLLTALMAMIED